MRPLRHSGCSGAERRRRCADFLGNANADGDVGSLAAPCVCFGGNTREAPPSWAVAAATSVALGSCSGAVDDGFFGAPLAVCMAPPMVAPFDEDGVRAGQALDTQGTPLRTLEMPHRVLTLQNGLMAASALQASAALMEFTILGDPFGGFTGCIVAGLGMQAASAGGFKFLPSYIVIAFANGTMKVLLGLELYNYSHVIKAIIGPISMAKFAATVVVASPLLMFAGLGLAWHLHCELRSLAMRVAAGASGLAPSLDEASGTLPPTQTVVPTEPGVGADAGMPASTPSPALPSGSSRGGSFRPFSGQPMRLVSEVQKS